MTPGLEVLKVSAAPAPAIPWGREWRAAQIEAETSRASSHCLAEGRGPASARIPTPGSAER